LASLLSASDYVFGQTPTSVDACLYGFIANILFYPINTHSGSLSWRVTISCVIAPPSTPPSAQQGCDSSASTERDHGGNNAALPRLNTATPASGAAPR
jgi:hypothetical protein